MARFALGVVCGMIISAVAGAAFATRAQEEDSDPGDIPAETVVTAIRVGIDPRALHGAVVTTHAAGAVAYLQHEGLLPKPPPSPPPPPQSTWTVWDRLAACESGGNWHIDAYHDGGLQFLPSTWLAYGGGAYARYAYQATREQQILVAQRLQAAAGWGQWPVCSRRIGLR